MRGIHIITLTRHQHLRPNHAIKTGPVHQHHGQNHIEQTRAQAHHQHHGKHHGRECHPQHHQGADSSVEPATDIARQNRQHCAQHHRACRGGYRHLKGHTTAINQARQNTSAQAIGSQGILRQTAVLPGGWQERGQQVLCIRIIGRQQGSKQGHQGKDQDQSAAKQHFGMGQHRPQPRLPERMWMRAHADLKRGFITLYKPSTQKLTASTIKQNTRATP